MKTNKFNSSNLILVVAVIVLLAGVSVGTYYGIKETNEKDYLKNKSSIILDVLNNIETSSENVSLNNDGYKVKDLKMFEDDLHNSLKDSPIIHTYFEPEEINGDTLYLYNDKEDKDSTFSNIRLYSYKSSKFIDINVISNSSYIKTYHFKINLPVRIELEETSISYVHDGYFSSIFNEIYIYDKDNSILGGFYSYINVESIKDKNIEYHINSNFNSNALLISNYRNGEYELKISLKDFENIEPVTFTLDVENGHIW